jgi:hypothetical protein
MAFLIPCSVDQDDDAFHRCSSESEGSKLAPV